MASFSSAATRIAVLPSPALCWPRAVCARISPRMYDSVNRFEPTRIGSCACTEQAATSSRNTPRRAFPFTARSQELQPREARVQTVLAHEIGVRALRHDRPALHDHDAVGMLNRRQPVRDGKRRAAAFERLQRLLDHALARRIERAGGLV